MKDFFKILVRYIPPYKGNLALNLLFNLLSALFSVFSLYMISPILEILFGMTQDVNEMVEWSASLDSVKHNIYYYITLM
ncbi:MAG: hypothetical protein FWG22_04425 [Prolixibacteraceae bacterium]|nr:hypothetical protein [Prolixibacteraceae bacterium]